MLDQGKISYDAPIPGLSVEEMMVEYNQPNKEDAIEEYFAHHVRYFTTFWNMPDTVLDQFGNGLGSQFSSVMGVRSPYPVDQINENIALYMGEQVNTNFSFMQRSISGQTLSVPMRPSQKGYQIINYLTGSYAKAIRNAKPHCKPISRQAISKREYALQLAEITASLREEFASLAQEAGVMIGPEEILGSDGSERVDEILSRTPKDKMEVLGNEILENIVMSNMITEKLASSYMMMEIGKYAAFHCRIQNGLPYIDLIDPRQLVFDPRGNCEFGSRSRFQGIVEFLTASQIAERGYDGFDKNCLREMIKNDNGDTSSLMTPYLNNVNVNMNWYGRGEKTYTVATFYWMGPEDLGIVYRDEPGSKTHFRDVKPKMDGEKETGLYEKGNFFKDIIYTATLIGNYKVVNYGPMEHIPYHPGDRLVPLSPIQMLLPDIISGRVKSSLDRVKDYISQLEAYRFKLSQKAAKAHGKVPVLNSAAFKKSPASIMNDISTWGFVIANFSGGEWLDPTTNKQLTSVMDFTMDSDVQMLMALAAAEEKIIDDVHNTTAIATGTQQTYVGYGTQQDSIAQATLGTANKIEKHAKFGANTLYVMVNMMKSYYATKEGKKKAEEVLSMASHRFLMETKDLNSEQLGVYVTLMDNLDEKERAAIITMAQTALPSGVNPEILNLFIDLIKTPTSTQMRDKIATVVRNIKKQEAAAAADQAEFAAQQQQAKDQIPLQQTQMQEMSETDREAMRQEGQNVRAGFEAEVANQGQRTS